MGAPGYSVDHEQGNILNIKGRVQIKTDTSEGKAFAEISQLGAATTSSSRECKSGS